MPDARRISSPEQPLRGMWQGYCPHFLPSRDIHGIEVFILDCVLKKAKVSFTFMSMMIVKKSRDLDRVSHQVYKKKFYFELYVSRVMWYSEKNKGTLIDIFNSFSSTLCLSSDVV